MQGKQIIKATDFSFPGQRRVYHGKVRDVYDFGESMMMVATDRYSAFDRHDLPAILHKGEILTAITRWWFEQTASIISNHVKKYPDPNVLWCKKYEVVPIEMVVRGYITGVTSTSLWHMYSQGQRDFGEFTLPDGLNKNDQLPEPVFTPTTKFEKNDRPLTPQEAIKEGLIQADIWERLKDVALKLFVSGQKTAAKKGLILVDTKYEFGLDKQGELVLIDEIHTPDSSRYWRADSYKAQIEKSEEPDNYDKEYLRLWYKARFDPYKDKTAPKVPTDILQEMANRYTFVYEQLLGKPFVADKTADPLARIEKNVLKALEG